MADSTAFNERYLALRSRLSRKTLSEVVDRNDGLNRVDGELPHEFAGRIIATYLAAINDDVPAKRSRANGILTLDVEGWTLSVRVLDGGYEVSMTEDGKCPSSHYVRLDHDQSDSLRDFIVETSLGCSLAEGEDNCPCDGGDTSGHDAACPERRSPAASDDLTASKEWNEGCDFAMTQLCKFLGIEPGSVSWDAATETVDGDVSAVIGNILRAKFGENWLPDDRTSRDEIAAGAFYKTRGDNHNLPHVVGPLEHADDADAPWQAKMHDQVWKWGYDGLANADGSPHNRDLVERVYRPSLLSQPASGSRWRHQIRGTTYRVLFEAAKAQSSIVALEDMTMVVYQGEADGLVWVRPASEFFDGRFVQLPSTDKNRSEP